MTKIKLECTRQRISLHVQEQGEKSVVLRRSVLVVVEKCCPEEDNLSHIVAPGVDGWLVGAGAANDVCLEPGLLAATAAGTDTTI